MATPPNGDLDNVRAEIDAIDRQIVELISRRQRQVEAAGRLKSDQAAVRAPDRVAKVIEKVRGLALLTGADPGVVEQTYRSMIGAFIELELTVHEGRGDSPADAVREGQPGGEAEQGDA